MDADVVDKRGRLLLRLEGYSTTSMPGAIEPGALQSIRRALAVTRSDSMAPARPFRRLAIVNRGEAAMRLIHAVRELGASQVSPIRTIALYTDPESASMFVREADEAYHLGPATIVDDEGHRRGGYLDYDALERALVDTRADGAWVGWGFVAEDPAFAELCERWGSCLSAPTPP